MSGFDELTYEAAAHRLDAFSQAMEQVSAQLNEKALVSIAGEMACAVAAKQQLEKRIGRILATSTMDENARESFWATVAEAAARVSDDLDAIEIEMSPGKAH